MPSNLSQSVNMIENNPEYNHKNTYSGKEEFKIGCILHRCIYEIMTPNLIIEVT